ncbi:MAG: PilW family protein [Pseudomonadota bacterium]
MKDSLMMLPKPSKERGLSLVELMVALALGGFLVLGVVNVFLTTKESSGVEAALARVQENGRFAMDLLAEDIRQTQYSGCRSVNTRPVSLAARMDVQGARGYRRSGGSWATALDPNDVTLDELALSGLQDDIRDDTDVLNLHLAERIGSDLLTADLTPTSTDIVLSANPDCAIGDQDYVMLANCLTAHIVQIGLGTACGTTLDMTAGDNRPLSIEPGYLYNSTESRTEVLKFESVIWYVADTGRNRNGMDVFALYRKVFDQAPEEMVEGVEFMQLQFGVREGSVASPSTRFIDAGSAGIEWDDVVSVRISLMVQNYDLVREDDDSRSYVMNDPNAPLDDSVHGGSRVLRQVFTRTLALRNTEFDA